MMDHAQEIADIINNQIISDIMERSMIDEMSGKISYPIEGELPCGTKYVVKDPFTMTVKPVKYVEYIDLNLTIQPTSNVEKES